MKGNTSPSDRFEVEICDGLYYRLRPQRQARRTIKPRRKPTFNFEPAQTEIIRWFFSGPLGVDLRRHFSQATVTWTLLPCFELPGCPVEVSIGAAGMPRCAAPTSGQLCCDYKPATAYCMPALRAMAARCRVLISSRGVALELGTGQRNQVKRTERTVYWRTNGAGDESVAPLPFLTIRSSMLRHAQLSPLPSVLENEHTCWSLICPACRQFPAGDRLVGFDITKPSPRHSISLPPHVFLPYLPTLPLDTSLRTGEQTASLCTSRLTIS